MFNAICALSNILDYLSLAKVKSSYHYLFANTSAILVYINKEYGYGKGEDWSICSYGS